MGGERQVDRERRAVTDPEAVRVDSAAMPLDDALGDGEPEAEPPVRCG
jgi:hypothetical protein